MEPKTIARIAVMPFGLMFGAISAIIGVIMGIIFAVTLIPVLYFSTPITPGSTGFPVPNMSFPVFFLQISIILLFPIAMFIVGLIQGVIFAAAYNFLAPRIGGILLYFK